MRVFNSFIAVLLAVITISVCSCVSEEPRDSKEIEAKSESLPLDFCAQLSTEQLANFETYGTIFREDQQQDSWNTVIASDIPSHLGWFMSPESVSRSVGVNGNGGQYWTMLRVKVGTLPKWIKMVLSTVATELERETNVRIYNSQDDDMYFTVGKTKYEYPNVKINIENNDNRPIGSGSFGLVGGEQYITIPNEYNRESFTDEDFIEMQAFLLHGLCNAAGMFNEQMRYDRDNFVTVYTDNIIPSAKFCFAKQTKNYRTIGSFDYHSITLSSSKSFSSNGNFTILKKNGEQIAKNYILSESDKLFLNAHYLPYIARDDNYIEFDRPVYQNGRELEESEILQLQNNMNTERGLSGTPPANKRKENKLEW